MTIEEAIKQRRSVRKYKKIVLSDDIINSLNSKIEECNRLGNLNIQLVTNEKRAFSGILSYGMFSGVENYFVIAGKSSDSLEENAGYYGEQLVLLAQQLGLNSCWVGLTYKSVKDAYTLNPGDKVVALIALGYGELLKFTPKKKTPEQLCKNLSEAPEWFAKGLEMVSCAPSAINQQKYTFEYEAPNKVKANKGFSLAGYTKVDLGIAKLHFEIGAGRDNFVWA